MNTPAKKIALELYARPGLERMLFEQIYDQINVMAIRRKLKCYMQTKTLYGQMNEML